MNVVQDTTPFSFQVKPVKSAHDLNWNLYSMVWTALTIADNDFADFSEQQNAVGRWHVKL